MNENQITREVPKHIILEVNNRSLYPHKDINKIRKCITREEKRNLPSCNAVPKLRSENRGHPNPPRHLVPPHGLMA
jgi:RNA polymerase-interacting CarD/CdnL/TRCF family regulator